jgi:DNA-binding LacI/PurR family transcriptional regulator
MAQDFTAMARGSVDTLLSMLDESDDSAQVIARKITLDGTLVMRQSA